MCARRFLMLVFVFTLIAVGGAFAIYQWGGTLLIREATPKGHFDAAQAGSGPHYTSASSWLARPGQPDDPSQWLPQNFKAESERGDAAIFYIHPTTYLKTDRWNAPLDAGGDTEFRSRLFVQSQASAFSGAGEIWAPRYRQAAYGAFLLKSNDANEALDLAYRDVAAAFDQFVSEAGNRPIILAGHSQGALHLERLLREKIAGKPIAKRIVAAYVVGWPIDVTSDLSALGLPACRAANQPGCVLSWMTFKEPANPDFIFDQWQKSRGFTGGERKRKDALCVNPISGVENGAAPAKDNQGTLIPTATMRTASLQPDIVGAHCANGLLMLDGKLPPIGAFVLPGNNYHVYDYALFWGAIRNDAMIRLAAWNHDHHQ